MAKCIQNNEIKSDVKRLSNEEAQTLVKAGNYHYIPKGTYKSLTRNQIVEEVSKKKRTKKLLDEPMESLDKKLSA